jgi:hypothetical protein
MSGLCLGAAVSLAMAVLTFFQPTSPSRPIVQTKKGQPPKETLNNARGYVWPYGDLKHLPAYDDDTAAAPTDTAMAKLVNSAISSASFLGSGWDKIRATGGQWGCLLLQRFGTGPICWASRSPAGLLEALLCFMCQWPFPKRCLTCISISCPHTFHGMSASCWCNPPGCVHDCSWAIQHWVKPVCELTPLTVSLPPPPRWVLMPQAWQPHPPQSTMPPASTCGARWLVRCH